MALSQLQTLPHRVLQPSYGRYLDEFHTGQIFIHPRGLTLHPSYASDFAGTFMEANPLYLARSYAQALGYDDQLVSPLMLLSATLSLGVQNESEKAIAHLGYWDVRFIRPTCVGSTLRAATRVLGVKARGAGEPGIVRLQTVGMNELDEVLIRYERRILVPSRLRWTPEEPRVDALSTEESKIWERLFERDERLSLKAEAAESALYWTAGRTYFEDFQEGDVILHPYGRTVTDEHFAWTYRLGNTHPLHFDRIYSQRLSGPMGGDPVVYGGLVFAWIAGLASRDVAENAVWDLGYDEGYHTAPVRGGDTLFAVSKVIGFSEGELPGTGAVQFQLVGLKNIDSESAWNRYGDALFMRESGKRKARQPGIPEKVFEIERRLLLRRRPESA